MSRMEDFSINAALHKSEAQIKIAKDDIKDSALFATLVRCHLGCPPLFLTLSANAVRTKIAVID